MAVDSFATPSWMNQAACLGKDTDKWFPVAGSPARYPKWVCSKCPVTAECLEFGLNDHYGVFGGYTPVERKEIRVERRRATMGGTENGQ